MIAEWFVSHPKHAHEWFGQTNDTIATIERRGVSAVASVVGARGEKGDQGADGPQGIQGVPGNLTNVNFSTLPPLP